MPLKLLGRALRNLLARRGYLLLKREYTRYGLSLFVDIVRFSRSWDGSVRTVFDVGANVGQFALEALHELPAARIYSFEPHPCTFKRLIAAISDSRLSAHPIALGERIGPSVMFVYGESGESSHLNSLVPNAHFPTKFGYAATQIAVPCTTIDVFCEENKIDEIDLLKIDTEGGDLLVLRGARRMFEEGRLRFVYVEFNTLLSEPDVAGGALFPIAEYLTPFGFRYVSAYTDFVFRQDDLFVCANALFVVPPDRSKARFCAS